MLRGLYHFQPVNLGIYQSGTQWFMIKGRTNTEMCATHLIDLKLISYMLGACLLFVQLLTHHDRESLRLLKVWNESIYTYSHQL